MDANYEAMLLAGTMLAMMSVAALAEETPPVPAPVRCVTCPYDLSPQQELLQKK